MRLLLNKKGQDELSLYKWKFPVSGKHSQDSSNGAHSSLKLGWKYTNKPFVFMLCCQLSNDRAGTSERRAAPVGTRAVVQPQPTVLSFLYVHPRFFNIKPGRNATSITFSAKQKQILSHH